ncbi:MAG: hypothetical protein AAF289_22665 [Cyanobacteria bacterium P01_A01_bin.135]
MSQPDSASAPNPRPGQRLSRTGRSRTEFDMLQSLLVEPEVDKLRHQVDELQQQVAELQAETRRLETEAQAFQISVNQLVDQKLAALRQSLLAQLPDIIDEAIEAQIDPGQTFSIRISGVEDDE